MSLYEVTFLYLKLDLKDELDNQELWFIAEERLHLMVEDHVLLYQ